MPKTDERNPSNQTATALARAQHFMSAFRPGLRILDVIVSGSPFVVVLSPVTKAPTANAPSASATRPGLTS